MISKFHWNLIWTLLTITSTHGTFGEYNFATPKTFVDDILETDAQMLNIQPFSFGIMTTITNATCKDALPFPDPDDITAFYQCYWIVKANGSYWGLLHYKCTTGNCFIGVEICSPCPTTDLPTSEASTTEWQDVSTISPSPPEYICVNNGLFPDPADPQSYYRCIAIFGQFYYYKYHCSNNTCFDAQSTLCSAKSCPFVCMSEGFFVDPLTPNSYYRCFIMLGQLHYAKYVCPATACYNKNVGLCVFGSYCNSF